MKRYNIPFSIHLSCTVYQQQQIPPQQGLSEEGSYQQQSYKAGDVFFVSFVFVFLSPFFVMTISYLTKN